MTLPRPGFESAFLYRRCRRRLLIIRRLIRLATALLLAQLPTDERSILSTLSKTEIADLALEADRITEVTRLTQDMQVNATGTSQVPLQRTQLGELRSGPSKSSTKMKKPPGMCKYYSTYGDQTKKCVPPCKFQTALGNVPPSRQ